MSIDGRLNKLIPALTAKERGILVLRSLQEGTTEDPLWRSTMPREQSSTFNHYIHLMNACNIYLPLYITMVEQHTEQFYLRMYWMLDLIQAGTLMWRIGILIPARSHAAAERIVTDAYPAVELPWQREDPEHSWMNVTDDMYTGLRLWLVSLWQELRSIDIVLAEVTEEFDGEDPLRPVMRGVLEKARRDLTLLHETFDKMEPLDLVEPDEETQALARKYFDNGYKLMSGL